MEEDTKNEKNKDNTTLDFNFNENEQEEKELMEGEKKDKKIKNLISIIILLAGLLVGSLFVDVFQAIKGNGYSQKNLNKSDIFETQGKTWVAYSEPAVPISIISDENCKDCDPSEAIVWLKRVLPTVSTEKVNFDSDQGKQMVSDFNIKTLPAFIFDKNVDKTDLYAQANPLFQANGDKYILNMQELGMPVGKYLELPKINEGDATFGKVDSKAKVIVFSDFQCPYCKVFYKTLRDTMENYQDKVVFDFKEFPLTDIHPQATSAALASVCALEQDKFWEYADVLYAKQSEWGAETDTASFKNYAKTLKLNSNQFNKCLDDKKYQYKIEADTKEARDFGVSGTPTVFINDQVETGVVDADQFKKAIEDQLNKK